MDLPEALSGISAYSSIQSLPLRGIKGLRLYLKPSRTPDQDQRMKDDLSVFQERFCKVLAAISRESHKAMLANVSVFKGIQQLFEGQPDELHQLSAEFAELTSIIDKILQGQRVPPQAVEQYFPRLHELSAKASKSAGRLEPESFPLFNPPR